jgi:hypothetical protein
MKLFIKIALQLPIVTTCTIHVKHKHDWAKVLAETGVEEGIPGAALGVNLIAGR